MSKIDFKSLIKAANIGINPHATIEANRLQNNLFTKVVPINRVPVKDMPTRVVPTNRVPVKDMPTRVVPTNRVPVKDMPTRVVPTNRVSVKDMPTRVVPTNNVPVKNVPTIAVPTNLYIPVNQAPVLNVGTTITGTTKKDVVNEKHINTAYLGENKVIITKVKIDNTLNEDLLNSLNKNDKINYLARRGWRISCEVRKNQPYDYAVKYINRQKKRIYLGKTELSNSL
jgi:hypothetical protein